LNNLGFATALQGDLDRAAAYHAEALALARAQGDRWGMSLALANLADLARTRGETAQAGALGREALALDWGRRDHRKCAEDVEILARTAGAAGQGVHAARLLGAAAAVHATVGAPQPPVERVDTEAAVALARAVLGDETWAAAFAAGQALSLEEAVAEALRTESAP
jgi:hypothetical protein